MLSLTATEAELTKTLNRPDATHNADGSPTAASTTQLQQLLAADQGNKRVIDQLNGHVDFLNEQLALREAQLVEVNASNQDIPNLLMLTFRTFAYTKPFPGQASEQIMRAENVQTEMVAKTRLLDQVPYSLTTQQILRIVTFIRMSYDNGSFGSQHSLTLPLLLLLIFRSCSPVQTRQRIAGRSTQSGRDQA